MSIPISAFVGVIPSILSAGAAGLQNNGLLLSYDRIPSGSVMSFASAAAVQAYYGLGDEATFAGIYFKGFDGCTILPSALLIAAFNQTPIQAWLKGGATSLTLAQLQASSGSLSVVVNGVTATAASVILTAATSFSNAATLITSALGYWDGVTTSATTIAAGTTTSASTGSITGNVFTAAGTIVGAFVVGGVLAGSGVTAGTSIQKQLSGTTGGAGTYQVSTIQNVGSTSITQTYGLMTVGAMTSGALAVGQTVTGGTIAANTTITALGTGTGAAGTYITSGGSQTVSATVVQAGQLVCTYDSIWGSFVITGGTPGAVGTISYASGTISAALNLTAVTGAVLSQGAAAQTPASMMNSIINQTTNWVGFTTILDPDNGYGNTQKQAFAAWNNSQPYDDYMYKCWDTDITPTASNSATSSLGYILAQNGNSGTELIWGTDYTKAAFRMGMDAATNFQQLNGRINPDYKHQAGLTADVSTLQVMNNLLANGYNCYVQVANTAPYYTNGSITGTFKWADSYLNQIQLNNSLQSTLLNLLTSINALPNNSVGTNAIYAALQTPIQAALNFGTINTGVQLSSTQAIEVNTAAGVQIANTLQTSGWYLQVLPAAPSVRGSRVNGPINFWYTDAGSINLISMASIAVQ